VAAKVAAIAYARTNRALALLHYTDGEKRYISGRVGVIVGDVLQSGEAVDIRPGNSPPCTRSARHVIHNIELEEGARRADDPPRGSFGS